MIQEKHKVTRNLRLVDYSLKTIRTHLFNHLYSDKPRQKVPLKEQAVFLEQQTKHNQK